MQTYSNKLTALERVLQILVAVFARSFTRKQTSPIPATPQSTPPHTNGAEFCCHSRHGAFPVRRTFKARGTSATGHPFLVFQCPAPACGEFVAKTTDVSTGQELILFRGHHFRARQDGGANPVMAGTNLFVQRQPRIVASSRAATFLLPLTLALLLAGAGCSRRSYFVDLQDKEAIALGSDVLLDGKKIGTVTEITRKGEASVRAAQFVVTALDIQLRAGTEREERGSMRLSSASCASTAPILESGSTVPTRVPITNFAKTTARGARDFIYRFFALHPAIAIAVPILALALGCLLFASCRRTLIALIVILIGVTLFLCAGSIAHAQSVATPVGQPGVFFTRDFLRQEQSLVRRHISEAERSSDTAARLLDGRLVRDGGEELVRGLFRLDSADLLLQGQPDRIAQLKSAALSYVRAEEQRKLTTVYAALRQQLQNAQERSAMLRLRCTSTNEQDTMLLQVFMAKREGFRIRARAGDTDPTAVLEECRRLASVNKSEADLARLRQQVDVELAQLRRARESNNSTVLRPPATIIVTNEVRTVIEKLVRTPAPPPVTNKVLQYVTNTVRVLVDRPVTNTVFVITNSNQALSVGTTGTNAAMTMNVTNPAAESDGVVVAEQGGATSASKMARNMTALLIGLGILIAIAVIVWLVGARDRTWVVKMATNGEGDSYEVRGSDRLILGGLPHAEHHAMVNGHPHIRPTWKGAIIFPGVEPVVVNGAPILKPQKLNPSDRITAQAGSESTEYDFLDCVRATEQLAED